MRLVGGTTAGRKIHTISSIREDSNQGDIQFIRFIWCDEHYAGISKWRGGFRAGIGNNRKAASNAGNRAASARRDRATNKEKHVARGKSLNDLCGFDDTFHRKLHIQIRKSMLELSFMKVRVSPKDDEAKATELPGSVADRGKNCLRFEKASFASGDAENNNRWHRVLRRMHLRRNGQVGTDRDEHSL